MERKFSFAVDGYYHVYSRGTDKRAIFLDSRDKERFLRSLHLFNSTRNFQFRDIKDIPLKDIDRGDSRTAIGAYCLMPNHFHLLLRETQEKGISVFMGKLLTSYSMYFNTKYKRTGALFESRFRAKEVTNENYLKYLFAYIHLNPVKFVEPEWKEKGIQHKKATEEFLKKYRYSSFEEYINISEREEKLILSKEAFPEFFENPEDFMDQINDWLTYSDEEEGVPNQEIIRQSLQEELLSEGVDTGFVE